MQIRNILHSLLERLLKAENEQVEIYYREENLLRVTVRRSRIDSVDAEDNRGIGVRAINGGRLAFCFTNDLSENGLGYLQESLENFLAVAEPDENNGFAEPQVGSEIDLRLVDDGFQDTLFLSERARELEAGALKHCEPTQVGKAIAECVIESTLIVNSLGVEVGVTKTIYRQEIELNLREGTGVAPVTNSHIATARDELLPARALGEECGDWARSLANGKELGQTSLEVPIVLLPYAGNQLVRALEDCLNGEHYAEGKGLLNVLRDEEIASPLLTLSEDPLIPGSYLSSLFDGEGVATTRKSFIDRGVLKTLLHNLHSARWAKVPPTGNAGRKGYSSLPGVTGFNLHIEPGESTLAEIMGRIGEGVLIFSFGAEPLVLAGGELRTPFLGWRIRNGNRAEPIVGAEVCGRIDDILLRIDAVGDEVDFKRQIFAPSLLIERMTVKGV